MRSHFLFFVFSVALVSGNAFAESKMYKVNLPAPADAVDGTALSQFKQLVSAMIVQDGVKSFKDVSQFGRGPLVGFCFEVTGKENIEHAEAVMDRIKKSAGNMFNSQAVEGCQ